MAVPRLVPASHLTSQIRGKPRAIDALRAQIRRFAAFDPLGSPSVPTVLLQGETGIGKGLVARVLHESGPRVEGPFLEVSCAAITETLLEAELFGFEVGAFTGAKRPKPGLFEAASGGCSPWTRSMPSRWRCRASCSRPLRRNACGASAPWRTSL